MSAACSPNTAANTHPGPVGLQLHGLFGILQRRIIPLERGIGRRAVGKKHIIGGVQLNGGSEVLRRLLKVAGLEGGVALVLWGGMSVEGSWLGRQQRQRWRQRRQRQGSGRQAAIG